MNKIMNKMFGLVAVMLAALMASNAFALQLSEDYTDAFIGIGTTENFNYLVVNDSDRIEKLSLESWTETYYISSIVTKEYIELLPGAREEVSITVKTKDSLENGIYSIWLKAVNQDGVETEIESKINAYETEAESDGLVRFEIPHKNFCKDEPVELVIKVINDSNSAQDVRLIADSDEFLPVFDPSDLYLPKNDYRYVDLAVKTFWYTIPGDYELDISARVGTEYVTSKAFFRIVDCAEPAYEPNDNVVTTIYDYSVDAEKNEVTYIRFNVRNLLDSTQIIRFSTNKTFVLAPESVTLIGGEDRDLRLAVKPVKRTSVGSHNVELFTYTNEMLADRDQARVNVLPLNSIFVDLLENNFTIRGCTGRLTEVYVRNTGDQRLAINVSAGPMPAGIDVVVNSPNFVLNPGESRSTSMYVVVSTSASEGLKEVPITVSSGSLSEERVLVFTALPRETFDPSSPVTIYSYNSRVVLTEGETDGMPVQIQNDNSEDYTGKVRIVYSDRVLYEKEVTVKANSIELVIVPFNTQGFAPGQYALTLEALFEETRDAKSVTLEVKEKEGLFVQGQNTSQNALERLTGLAGLVTTDTGLILIVIGLFILIGLIALGSFFLGKGSYSESATTWRVEE